MVKIFLGQHIAIILCDFVIHFYHFVLQLMGGTIQQIETFFSCRLEIGGYLPDVFFEENHCPTIRLGFHEKFNKHVHDLIVPIYKVAFHSTVNMLPEVFEALVQML